VEKVSRQRRRTLTVSKHRGVPPRQSSSSVIVRRTRLSVSTVDDRAFVSPFLVSGTVFRSTSSQHHRHWPSSAVASRLISSGAASRDFTAGMLGLEAWPRARGQFLAASASSGTRPRPRPNGLKNFFKIHRFIHHLHYIRPRARPVTTSTETPSTMARRVLHHTQSTPVVQLSHLRKLWRDTVMVC